MSDNWLFIDELKLMGYGESDSSGCWIKLQVDEDILTKVRGMKGGMCEVAFRWIDNDGTPPPVQEKKGEHGQYIKKLHQKGFFRAPAVWESLGTDDEYREWIQKQKSCVSGQWSEYVNGEGRCEAAHVRRANESGTGYKPRYCCVPLTREEHMCQHQKGEEYLLYKYNPSFGIGDMLSNDEAKEWFDTQRIKHCEKWAHAAMREHFQVDSLTNVDPVEIQKWATKLGLMAYLPTQL